MFDRIVRALSGAELRLSGRGGDDLRLAIAALLVHAAQADEQFEPVERATIERILSARFRLGPWETSELIRAAEQDVENASGLYRFIQCIVQQTAPEDRVQFIEMLWEVAYADGTLSPDEDALIRRIAGLVYVTDFDRGAARKRALDRLGIKEL